MEIALPMRNLLVAVTLIMMSPIMWADYSTHKLAPDFIEKMVKEHNFAADEVKAILAKAERKQSILDAISRPAEKTKEWHEYRKIFLGEKRINQGIEFWRSHKKTILRASEVYGVAPEIIVAIIGVETRYGRHTGTYRVLDALATLGFDYPKRGKFFRSELEQFLLLVREQDLDVTHLKGSYAGAMGYGQFIPSSYRAYAVDFDADNKVDIWQNPVDAIGSVANYFKAHKWQTDQPVLTRARIQKEYEKDILNKKNKPTLSLSDVVDKGFTPVDSYDDQLRVMPLVFTGDYGKEFWLGFDNFYVITRYNRSHMYALAVWQLSQEIKSRMAVKTPSDDVEST